MSSGALIPTRGFARAGVRCASSATTRRLCAGVRRVDAAGPSTGEEASKCREIAVAEPRAVLVERSRRAEEALEPRFAGGRELDHVSASVARDAFASRKTVGFHAAEV